MAFGDRLKAWRMDHGMDQKDFIEEVNRLLDSSKKLTSQAVSSWESGKHYPNYDVIFILPFITHLTLEALFQDELYRIDDVVPNHSFADHPMFYKDIFEEQQEQKKGKIYKYRKGNFICELTAI